MRRHTKIRFSVGLVLVLWSAGWAQLGRLSQNAPAHELNEAAHPVYVEAGAFSPHGSGSNIEIVYVRQEYGHEGRPSIELLPLMAGASQVATDVGIESPRGAGRSVASSAPLLLVRDTGEKTPTVANTLPVGPHLILGVKWHGSRKDMLADDAEGTPVSFEARCLHGTRDH